YTVPREIPEEVPYCCARERELQESSTTVNAACLIDFIEIFTNVVAIRRCAHAWVFYGEGHVNSLLCQEIGVARIGCSRDDHSLFAARLKCCGRTSQRGREGPHSKVTLKVFAYDINRSEVACRRGGSSPIQETGC